MTKSKAEDEEAQSVFKIGVMVKKLFSRFMNSQPGRKALSAAEQAVRRFEAERANQLLVLTYHDVSDPVSFESQMSFLAANYNAVSVTDVLKAFCAAAPVDAPPRAPHHDRPIGGDNGPAHETLPFSVPALLPPRALLITFDDAYRSFANDAWPIMQRYNLPATLFVATAFPDAPDNVFWWDRLEEALRHTARRDELDSPAGKLSLATESQRNEALKQLKSYLWQLPQTELLAWVHEICARLGIEKSESRVLGWEELRRLKREGVILAPHSRTHPDMSRLSRQEAQREIAASFADLQRETGSVPPVFAYPGGHYSQETMRAAAQENVLLAFATLRGTNDLARMHQGMVRFALRRNHMGDRATLSTLQSRLLYGSRYLNRYHAFRKNKKGV